MSLVCHNPINRPCLKHVLILCVGLADLHSSMQGGRASFPSLHTDHSLPGPGPAKKRKRNPGSQRHWDDPGQQSGTLPYDDDEVDRTIEDVAVDDAEEEEESRELTYDEIWDDSALIAAWESATAEYEVSRPMITLRRVILMGATTRLITVREKIGRKIP